MARACAAGGDRPPSRSSPDFAISVAEKSALHYRSDPSVTASIDHDLRPKLWAVAGREFLRSPWVGHGFGREILEEKFLTVTPKGIGHPPIATATTYSSTWRCNWEPWASRYSRR
jgi:hypothetical protein